MADRMANAAYAMQMRQRMGTPGGAKPVLPESIRSRLDARYGKSGEDELSLDPTGTPAGESMAARMARRRQQRSEQRTAAMSLEDARGGPSWQGIGLRDVTINHQSQWQQQMQQNQQQMMEQQMQREQDALQQRLLAKEKLQMQRQKARAEAKGRNGNKVVSHLKVSGSAALPLTQPH